jgi:hypothetical protein
MCRPASCARYAYHAYLVAFLVGAAIAFHMNLSAWHLAQRGKDGVATAAFRRGDAPRSEPGVRPSFAIMTKPAPAHFEGSEGFDVVTSRDVGAAHLDEEKAAKQAEAVAVAVATAPPVTLAGAPSESVPGQILDSSSQSTPPPASPNAPSPKPATEKPTSDNWRDNIDIFVGWSGPFVNGSGGGADASRDRDNGEMAYFLRSIAQNAPWINHVWVVMNGAPAELPVGTLVPPSLANRVSVVNRCTYMPQGSCPTRNSHAVFLFAHRLPKLADRFIMAEDDIFLGRPAKPSDFFSGPTGKPFYWRDSPSYGFFYGKRFHRLYEDPSVVTFPTPKSSAPSRHYWYPQLKSLCAASEAEFPEWYQFASSHTEGRYSSKANGVSDTHNSQEECAYGVMSWQLSRGKGVYRNLDSLRGNMWDEVSLSEVSFKLAAQRKPLFMNVQDHFHTDVSSAAYQKQVAMYKNNLDAMFPKETDRGGP